MSYESQLYREATGEHESRPFNPFGDEIEQGEAETLQPEEPNESTETGEASSHDIHEYELRSQDTQQGESNEI